MLVFFLLLLVGCEGSVTNPRRNFNIGTTPTTTSTTTSTTTDTSSTTSTAGFKDDIVKDGIVSSSWAHHALNATDFMSPIYLWLSDDSTQEFNIITGAGNPAVVKFNIDGQSRGRLSPSSRSVVISPSIICLSNGHSSLVLTVLFSDDSDSTNMNAPLYDSIVLELTKVCVRPLIHLSPAFTSSSASSPISSDVAISASHRCPSASSSTGKLISSSMIVNNIQLTIPASVPSSTFCLWLSNDDEHDDAMSGSGLAVTVSVSSDMNALPVIESLVSAGEQQTVLTVKPINEEKQVGPVQFRVVYHCRQNQSPPSPVTLVFNTHFDSPIKYTFYKQCEQDNNNNNNPPSAVSSSGTGEFFPGFSVQLASSTSSSMISLIENGKKIQKEPTPLPIDTLQADFMLALQQNDVSSTVVTHITCSGDDIVSASFSPFPFSSPSSISSSLSSASSALSSSSSGSSSASSSSLSLSTTMTLSVGRDAPLSIFLHCAAEGRGYAKLNFQMADFQQNQIDLSIQCRPQYSVRIVQSSSSSSSSSTDSSSSSDESSSSSSSSPNSDSASTSPSDSKVNANGNANSKSIYAIQNGRLLQRKLDYAVPSSFSSTTLAFSLSPSPASSPSARSSVSLLLSLSSSNPSLIDGTLVVDDRLLSPSTPLIVNANANVNVNDGASGGGDVLVKVFYRCVQLDGIVDLTLTVLDEVSAERALEFSWTKMCGQGGVTVINAGSASGLSSTSIFVITALSLITFACGLGCVYNATQHNARGIEMVPGTSFIQETLYAGAEYVHRRRYGDSSVHVRGRGPQSDYDRISAEEDEYGGGSYQTDL